jgi:lantibiotic leader peptide-processing serine protease
MKTNPFKWLSIFALFIILIGCVDNLELKPNEKNKLDQARISALNSIPKIEKNQFIIMANDLLPNGLESEVVKAGGSVITKMSQVGIAVATSKDPNFAAKAKKISGIRSVMNDFSAQWIEPAMDIQVLEDTFGNPPNSGDDDIRFDLQWGHKAINAVGAWNAGYRGSGATVAVLDSGFDLDQPDLAPNIIGSKSFVPGEAAQYNIPGGFSHGTHVAGTIAAADNAKGIIGVAPLSKLLLVKVLRDSGSGQFSWMLNGMIYATDNGADVINLSLGAVLPRNGKFLNDDGTISNETKDVQELLVAIARVTNYANKNGVTVIAAAGNDGIDFDHAYSYINIPSSAPKVISISATAPIGWAMNPATNLDIFTDYSNYGSADVSFAAPGGNSWDAVPNTNCTVAGLTRPCWVFDLVFSSANTTSLVTPSGTWAAGTSMASPHAAGVAALIVGKNGGSMAPSAVEAKLRASADDLGKPGQDPLYGYGRVNALRAVQ